MSSSADDPVPNILRTYIRHLRHKQGVSISALAQHCNIPQTTWSDWENEQIEDLPATSLFQATTFLGGSLQHLFQLLQNPDTTLAIRLADAAVGPVQPAEATPTGQQMTDADIPTPHTEEPEADCDA